MSEHPIKDLMGVSMEKIKEMVNLNTIIGTPIQSPDGTVIIPISKVSFGFAAGGSEFNEETIEEILKTLKHFMIDNTKENLRITGLKYKIQSLV